MPFSLKGKLSLDGKAFKKGVDKAKRAVGSLGESMNRATRKMRVGMWRAKKSLAGLKSKVKEGFKTTGGKIAAAVGAAVIIDQVKQTIEWATKVRDLAHAWGISTAEVQKFQSAANQSGIEIEDVMDNMKDLSKSAAEATAGNEGKVSMFRAIGIEVDQLRGKNPAEIFRLVAKAIQEMGAITTPEALIAIEGLGGGAGMKTLNMMKGNFEELIETVSGFGIATDASIQKLGALGDKMDEISKRWMVTKVGGIAGGFGVWDDTTAMAEAFRDEFEQTAKPRISPGGNKGIGLMIQAYMRMFTNVPTRQADILNKRKGEAAEAREAVEKANKKRLEDEEAAANVTAQKAAEAETKKKAEAAAQSLQQVWGGNKATGLERIGGRIGTANTQLNISQKQLALMIQAQEKRAELAKNLQAITQAFNG